MKFPVIWFRKFWPLLKLYPVCMSFKVSQSIKHKLGTTVNNVAPVLCPRRVQATPWIIAKEERMGAVSRRLQVLSSCLHHIFDFKLSDARKVIIFILSLFS